MSSTKIRARGYVDDENSNAPALILSAVVLFGLSILMVYILMAEPRQGTMMSAIREVMRGLAGALSYALPLLFAWPAALCVYAARGGRISPLKVVADVVMVFFLFAAVHIFWAEEIVRDRMTIMGFANFVHKSYGYGEGGGAMGALLAWPLYCYLGVAGGFIGAMIAIVIGLTATGRFQKWFGWFSDRMDSRPEPAPRPEPKRAPRREPPRQMRVREPDRRTARRIEETRPRRASAPPRRRSAGGAIEEPMAPVPSRGRRKKLYNETVRTQKPQEEDPFDAFMAIDPESILKHPEDSGRRFAPDRSAAVEQARAAKAAGEDAPPPPPRMEKVNHIEDIPDIEDIPGMADFPEPEDAPEPSEDLSIEPVPYEDDVDDTPFDIPARKRAKKEELPKIERDEMKVFVEEDAPEYNYPPIDLLQSGESEDVNKYARRDREKAQLLEDTLLSFGITAKLTGIAHGPAVTRFELQPAPGIKVSRITSLSDDIALNLAAMSVRIEAPIPGKAAVGVEIPNDKVEMVRLRDVLESPEARKHPSRIAVGLGKDNSGRYIVADIAKMPHVLIAGQTGSGKSVCINAIIASILFRASPEEVRLILIDPKVVELSIYNDIPHLVCPVVTDPKKAASALDWAVAEMTRRYKMFAEKGVRDIKGYNKALEPEEPAMPQMVIIIDELADLMMVSPGEVEDSICRIAQLARACGMHLVIATQRPSVNVITGIIKANIPTRIAFSVASQVDSRTMIDHGGAEKLLGNGDMLFVPNGGKSMRVQGAWVSDEEVHAIVEYIKQDGEAAYDPDMIEHLENAVKSDAEKEEMASEYDPRLPEAVDIVMDLGQASISMLQRRMRIGYARAGRLIDDMARRGIVSEADGAKPRSVLITRDQAHELFDEETN